MDRPLHLDIAGMSCGHCVTAVTRELKRLAGVHVRQVDVGTADLTYDDGRTSPAAIARAVEEAGYAVTSHS